MMRTRAFLTLALTLLPTLVYADADEGSPISWRPYRALAFTAEAQRITPAPWVNGSGVSLGAITLPAGTCYQWAASGSSPATTFLCEDAANTLAQRNGTNAQAFRVYNTFTDAANYERGVVAWASNELLVGVQKAGTGSDRVLRLTGLSGITFDPGAAGQSWQITAANGHLFAFTDNAVDIGATGASRPRAVYVATSAAVEASTLGACLHTLTSTATNDDPTECVRQQWVATTGATVTTIDTIAIPATTTVAISCYVINRRTGGVSGTAEDGAAYRIEVVLKNVAGTATEIAAETLTLIGESIAGYTVTAAPSGANELIQVTGAATTNITWHSTCRTWNVGS